jgi:hypothetical protein
VSNWCVHYAWLGIDPKKPQGIGSCDNRATQVLMCGAFRLPVEICNGRFEMRVEYELVPVTHPTFYCCFSFGN